MKEKFYDVILEKADTTVIMTIGLIREIVSLDYNDAKNIATVVPSTVRKALTKEDADALVKKFKMIGAEVSLKESEDAESVQRFDVVLTSKGSDISGVTILVRNIFGMSLLEAKNLIAAPPCVIRKNIMKEDAEAIKGKLEAAGATVEIKLHA